MIYTIQYPEDKGIKYNEIRYPGGETQIRFEGEQLGRVLGAEEIQVWATIRDGEVMGLALLSEALMNAAWRPSVKRSLIMPYLPYARADRRFIYGDCFGLKTFASIINELGYDEIVTLDAHSNVASQVFLKFKDVSPKPLIEAALNYVSFGGERTAVLLPDAGATRYGINGFQCSKIRDPRTGKLSGFQVPEIEGYHNALIIDDICDGGRTFLGIADQIPSHITPYLYVTHGIFSQGIQTLTARFKNVITTNSLPQVIDANLMVVPCGGVIRDAILTPEQLWENGSQS